MKFTETKLPGAFVIEPEIMADERGFFARSFCQQEFIGHQLKSQVAQCNISYNKKKGTLRGMHYQLAPHQEAKLVSCIKGAIYDVIVDLRLHSPTYCQWVSIELRSDTYQMLYIPVSFAHGFQALEDDAVVFYQMFEFYHPESSCGVRWNDPAFGIKWPVVNPIISDRDRSYPDFKS
jgi:dTDP-4-dehydrorhamnose 3,5-epimerase